MNETKESNRLIRKKIITVLEDLLNNIDQLTIIFDGILENAGYYDDLDQEVRFELRELRKADKLYQRCLASLVPLEVDFHEAEEGRPWPKRSSERRVFAIPKARDWTDIVLTRPREPMFNGTGNSPNGSIEKLIDAAREARQRLLSVKQRLCRCKGGKLASGVRQARGAACDELVAMQYYRSELAEDINRKELLELGLRELKRRLLAA